jgi:hypothetical protein
MRNCCRLSTAAKNELRNFIVHPREKADAARMDITLKTAAAKPPKRKLIPYKKGTFTFHLSEVWVGQTCQADLRIRFSIPSRM